ncbi:P-loop containing nucleoside triphosphate hydrolase protein [Hyaloraphidium curvatum]|nr:P-loop containing nucleoside triphosphate hydrolase protein [Hyaloraphidium curvatum]
MSRTFVVGIGGASCSGKSTLADSVFRLLPRCVMLRQDAYYLPESDLPRHPVFETNWDIPGSFENSRLVEDLLVLKSLKQDEFPAKPGDLSDPTLNLDDRTDAVLAAAARVSESHADHLTRIADVSFVVVEGICLFTPEILPHLDFRVFLSAPEPVLRSRRQARSGYLTAEGSVFVDPPAYWEKLVWPAYLATNSFLGDPDAVQRLRLIEHDSGSSELPDILASVVERLVEHVSSA